MAKCSSHYLNILTWPLRRGGGFERGICPIYKVKYLPPPPPTHTHTHTRTHTHTHTHTHATYHQNSARLEGLYVQASRPPPSIPDPPNVSHHHLSTTVHHAPHHLRAILKHLEVRRRMLNFLLRVLKGNWKII